MIARLIGSIAAGAGLKPLDRGGVVRVIEHAPSSRRCCESTTPAASRKSRAAIRNLLPKLTPQQCANFFSEAGYAAT
jgi:hypothetical protein